MTLVSLSSWYKQILRISRKKKLSSTYLCKRVRWKNPISLATWFGIIPIIKIVYGTLKYNSIRPAAWLGKWYHSASFLSSILKPFAGLRWNDVVKSDKVIQVICSVPMRISKGHCNLKCQRQHSACKSRMLGAYYLRCHHEVPERVNRY